MTESMYPQSPFWARHIGNIRGEASPDLLPSSRNRYCVTVRERDGETAYYFGVPIRATGEQKPVSAAFEPRKNGTFSLHGTAGEVEIDAGKITLKSRVDTIRVTLGFDGEWQRQGEALAGGDYLLFPTANGIAVKKNCPPGTEERVRIQPGIHTFASRSNTKSFSVMAERHTPLVTLSGWYAEKPDRICPVRVRMKKETDGWLVSVRDTEEGGSALWYELDLYEPKLIQDTTVDTQNPKENNAFGMTAFLGNTPWLGEQQLYFKWNLSVLSGMLEKRLRSVRLFFCRCAEGADGVTEVYTVPNGFCSFGTNWEKRVPHGNRLTSSFRQGNFCVLDLSPSLIGKDGRLKWCPGFLLTTQDGSLPIFTADSYRCPPVLEFQYEA